MVSRIMKLIGLISLTILDRSLIAEAAGRITNDDSMAEHRSARESSVIRLPPDIVIPLPFVYPEYNDPREQVSAANIEQTSRGSLGDAILENVRNTMLVWPSEETEVLANNHVTDKPISRKTNRHRSSLVRSEINNETQARPDGKDIASGEDGDERTFENPSMFGTHGRSNNQVFTQTTSRTNDHNDPHEHLSSVGKNQQTSKGSLGDAILENVRNTMLVSPSEETEVLVKDHVTDKPISRKTNRHRSSVVRSEINNETPARPDGKDIASGEDGDERTFENPSMFGTNGSSNNQEFTQTTSRTNDHNEFNDPHEHLSSVGKNQQTSKGSLGDAILENVRNTMLVSPSEETEVLANNHVTDKPISRKTNRHRSSVVRSEINNETPARLDGKNCTSSEDGSDRASESALKFGTRLRSSHGNSNGQELVQTRSRTNAGVEDGSVRNGSEVMSQSSRGSPGRSSGRAGGDISMRRNPEASIRHTVPRRRRPNVDSSGDNKSEADVTEPRSLAGRIFRRKTQTKSRTVENDQE